MNMKISKELHEQLCKLPFDEYLFGSQLHGIADENSDSDYIRVISDDFYNRFTSLAYYYPNIHSFQHTVDKNLQIVWMTKTQFWNNLFSADGNMIADVVLLSGEFSDPLHLCRTYRVIKGYLGLVKRDLKLHPKYDKKRFHATRGLYMVECLIDGVLPTVKGIQELKEKELLPNNILLDKERELRSRLNDMLNKAEITHYPIFDEEDELVKMMMHSNNIIEFKY